MHQASEAWFKRHSVTLRHRRHVRVYPLPPLERLLGP